MAEPDGLDIPPFLRLSQEERRAAWAAYDAARKSKGPDMKGPSPKADQVRALREANATGKTPPRPSGPALKAAVETMKSLGPVKKPAAAPAAPVIHGPEKHVCAASKPNLDQALALAQGRTADAVMLAPATGFDRMKKNLGADAAENLRQQVLADQQKALNPKPAPQAPEQPKETTVKTSTAKKTPAKAQNRATRRAAKSADRKAPKTPAAKPARSSARQAAQPKATKAAGKSKMDIIQDMLTQEGGTTRKELSDATGFPSVNLTKATERAIKTLGKPMKLVDKDGRVSLVPKD